MRRFALITLALGLPLVGAAAQAGGLRRALLWLGIIQPEGSARAPLWPAYVCSTCGALVAVRTKDQHEAWHQRLGG